MGNAATQEEGYRSDLKGTAKSPFNVSAPDSLDTGKVTNHLNARIDAMNTPEEFAGNPGEWKRRMGEIARENLANKYLSARQDGGNFGTGDAIRTIDALPADYKPVKNETYAMEHDGLKSGNLNPATLQAQKTLDKVSDALYKADFMGKNGESYSDTAAKSATASTEGISKTLAQNNIPAADAANYYELSTGNTLSDSVKTGLLEKEKAPAAQPVSAAPAAPAVAP